MMIEGDPNPFHGCEIDEIFALVFDLEGQAGLRALLAQTDLDREDLTAAADKLEQAGLVEASKIVLKAAKKADTRASIEIAAIMSDPYRANRRAYFARGYRWGHFTINDLIAAGVDPEDIEFAIGSEFTAPESSTLRTPLC